MDEDFEHATVDHLAFYAQRSGPHNGIENFWSLLKRGINGTYVSVEPFHRSVGVDEQAFLKPNNSHRDGEVISAIKSGRPRSPLVRSGFGKRLTLSGPIEGRRKRPPRKSLSKRSGGYRGNKGRFRFSGPRWFGFERGLSLYSSSRSKITECGTARMYRVTPEKGTLRRFPVHPPFHNIPSSWST